MINEERRRIAEQLEQQRQRFVYERDQERQRFVEWKRAQRRELLVVMLIAAVSLIFGYLLAGMF